MITDAVLCEPNQDSAERAGAKEKRKNMDGRLQFHGEIRSRIRGQEFGSIWELMRLSGKFRIWLVVPTSLVICLAILFATNLWRKTGTLRRALEESLRVDLKTLRMAIDDYTLDRLKPPRSLQELVDARYIREIPVDPMTRKADWTITFDDSALSPERKVMGVVDVHSRSTEVGTNGTPYNTW